MHVLRDEGLDQRPAAGMAYAANRARHLLDQHPSAGPHRVVEDLRVGAVVLLTDVRNRMPGSRPIFWQTRSSLSRCASCT